MSRPLHFNYRQLVTAFYREKSTTLHHINQLGYVGNPEKLDPQRNALTYAIGAIEAKLLLLCTKSLIRATTPGSIILIGDAVWIDKPISSELASFVIHEACRTLGIMPIPVRISPLGPIAEEIVAAHTHKHNIYDITPERVAQTVAASYHSAIYSAAVDRHRSILHTRHTKPVETDTFDTVAHLRKHKNAHTILGA